jgi:Ca-activated chloride channel homolog
MSFRWASAGAPVARVATRWLWPILGVVLLVSLSACDRGASGGDRSAQGGPGVLRVLAGSEVKDLEPLLVKTAQDAGVDLRLSYAGTLDIVERINAGESFDAILPASSAYPSLALEKPPLAREKLFYSRVALGIKPAKLHELGWDRQRPTWSQIAQAAGAGKLRFAMTNPASSNSGMSALFAVASAVAGKTEDLQAHEVDAKVLKAFLSGQKLTAGSSGWLAEAYAREFAGLDAMVNYEAVILRANATLPANAKMTLLYPQDGVISADYPLMLVSAQRRPEYDKLVAVFKAAAFQKAVTETDFLRPSVPGLALGQGLSTEAVAELSFPNQLAVIDSVLGSYLGDWRRPATSIFVLDVSGSMSGERMDAMRDALKVLAGASGSATASARYAGFQRRERVVLISFSDRTLTPVAVDFSPEHLDQARQQVLAYADDLRPRGGTAIYDALVVAEAMADEEHQKDAERYISIVLLTDGENVAGRTLGEFQEATKQSVSARVFPILFGESNTDDMQAVAQATGGRVFDGRKAQLAKVFKEIRGYH